MSFILDALRKSEHERQRSALPGLSQVPLATPAPRMPRWALVVIGVLGTAVLLLGGAWWQSTRSPVELAATSPATMVERDVELPPPRVQAPAAPPNDVVAPPRPLAQQPPTQARESALAAAAPPNEAPQERTELPPQNVPALPSAAALAAEGVVLPTLHLELHAYSEQPSARFVFINGRKYSEGQRLAEGPELVSIEPKGVVLAQSGQRFLLVPE